MVTNSRTINEIEIPVPWGHIAGKTWGENESPLVLCFHGLMDNAGSFDRLIPYLPNCFYYVCIDLPGHGRSSQFPQHILIHALNYLVAYRYIYDHFQRKWSVIAHSYGAQIAYLFGQLYPECIEKLVMLDAVTFYPISTRNASIYLSRSLDQYIKIEKMVETKERPTYTREEALEKLFSGRMFAPITKEAAVALLDRSIESVGGERYRFTVDPRIKASLLPLRDIRYIKEGIRHTPLKCPALIIFGSESKLQQIRLRTIIDILKKQKNCRVKYVSGNHDVHNDKPEVVAPYVKKFLLMKHNKL